MTLLYHGADLIWMTKLRGGAEALGIPVRAVRSVEMLEARLADTPVKGLIVDLDAPEVALPLIDRAARHNREAGAAGGGGATIRIAAFGPHVDVERFAQAKAAGADQVMPRGALAARMEYVLKGLVEG